MTVSANDYIHPQDKAALDNFKSIPFFTTLLKSFMSFFSEQMLHGVSMAQKIRLSDKQLPEIYNLLPPIVSALNIKEPEFYLEMSPIPNAYTQGSTTTFLTVTSGLLEYLDENELRTVLAHECGHIACNHVLYHTMAMYIFNYGVVNMGILSNAALPLQIALYAWMRKSELSADRAAAVAMGGPNQVVETMIKLAGGPESITKNINIEEYIKQADAYDKIKTGSSQDKFLQFLAKTSEDHPFYAERTREILEWCKT
ncbi:MAG: M48 family metallopeptidase [Clostridia bacterium]|nr:M48 family metallopeptidase [Clostridia bacterium]